MKKLKVTVALLCALFFSGCQEENITPTNDSREATREYLPPTLEPPVLVPKLPFDTYGLKAISVKKIDSLHAVNKYPLKYNIGLPYNLHANQVIETPFNNAQIAILQPFVNKILTLESTYNVRIEVKNYEKKVALTSLTKNEKLMLLAVSTNVLVACDFIDSGKAAEIQQKVSQELGIKYLNSSSAGRFSGSCIDTKGILRGAVVSGMGAAVAGAYAGATGGTFVVPGAGTVTGGVAGAVLGFASGYTSGILYGVATDFLFKCLGRSNRVIDCPRYYSDKECQEYRWGVLRKGGLVFIPKVDLVATIY